MPLGIQQNNNFAQIIVDIWNDKVFYQEQSFRQDSLQRRF